MAGEAHLVRPAGTLRVRRAIARSRLVCVACGDRAAGIELGTLSAVSAAGGPLSVDLCTDCVRELITLCQRNANAGVNAASTQPLTLAKTQGNADENAVSNVSVSDLPQVSPLLFPLAPSEPQDQTRRGVEPRYSAEFEAFWDRCKGKKGNKMPAYRNFQRLRPPVENAVQRWNLWMTTTQWQRGFSKHMEGWINARGWEDEPDPSEFENPSTLPPKVEQSRATAVAWAHKVTG